MPTEVSIILVGYNSAHLLNRCFSALLAATRSIKSEIVFIDNASRDGSADLIRNHCPQAQLIENTVNVGFGRANNQALNRISGRYVLLLNTDAFVRPDTVTKTLAYMEAHPKCGILGVRLTGHDGELQPSCRFFPTPWNLFLNRAGMSRFFPRANLVDDLTWDHNTSRQCDWVPGCYYLVRREVIVNVGLFDPRYFLYYEEVDHCFAAKRAGWEVHYCSDTTVVHIGGESAKSEGLLSVVGRQLSALQVESELLYFRKNHGFLGLWMSFGSSVIAEALLAAKDILKMRGIAPLIAHTHNIIQVISLVARTRLGTQPTR